MRKNSETEHVHGSFVSQSDFMGETMIDGFGGANYHPDGDERIENS